MANGANSNTDSYTSIGYSYQLPPGESAKAFFTGSFRFQAAEVEVFLCLGFRLSGSSLHRKSPRGRGSAEGKVGKELVGCLFTPYWLDGLLNNLASLT